jgi:hypothetical protein
VSAPSADLQDGDKRLYSPMLNRLVDLLRPGLLVAENVSGARSARPVKAPQQDAGETRAIADYNNRLSAHRTCSRPLCCAWRIDFGEAVRLAGHHAHPHECPPSGGPRESHDD